MRDMLDPKNKLKAIMNGGDNQYYQYPDGIISPDPTSNTTVTDLLVVAGACVMAILFIAIAIPTLI